MVLFKIVIVGCTLAAGYIRKFSTRARDPDTMAFITVLVLLAGRACTQDLVTLSQLVGLGMSDAALGMGVPIAGGAMLVRILINSGERLHLDCWHSLLSSNDARTAGCACHLLHHLGSMVAAVSLMHTKERLNIFRSGPQTGLVNAALALVIAAFAVYLDAGAGGTQPYGMSGLLSQAELFLLWRWDWFPCLSAFGSVTDFKMLELATQIILASSAVCEHPEPTITR